MTTPIPSPEADRHLQEGPTYAARFDHRLEVEATEASVSLLHDAYFLDKTSPKSNLLEAVRDIKAIEKADTPYLPKTELMVAANNSDRVAAGRQQVQDYANLFNKDLNKLDPQNKGIVTDSDLEAFLQRPDLSKNERDMGQFFHDSYQFIQTLPKYPIVKGEEGYKGDGIYPSNIEALVSLTDAAKYKSMINRDSFSGLAGWLAGTATAIGVSTGMAVASESVTTVGGIVAGLGAFAVVGTGLTLGAFLAAGTAVGYLVYRQGVREYYSGKRHELEDILSRSNANQLSQPRGRS